MEITAKFTLEGGGPESQAFERTALHFATILGRAVEETGFKLGPRGVTVRAGRSAEANWPPRAGVGEEEA